MIVMPDADLDQAVDALIGAGYGSAGERCMAISVAVPVGEQTAQRLRGRLIERDQQSAGRAQPGPQGGLRAAGYRAPRWPGCVITSARVWPPAPTWSSTAASAPATIWRSAMRTWRAAYFIGPTLFDHVTPDMSIYTDEIFGPVLCIVRAHDYEEALRLPSEHEYGNGVAIFTRDGDTARDFVSRVQVGMVGVNVPIPVPVAYHTFGGWKRSGFGDLNQHGPASIQFYTKVKTVTSRWPSGIKDGAEFVIPTMK